MFCINCGANNVEEANFCARCGYKIVDARDNVSVTISPNLKSADKNNSEIIEFVKKTRSYVYGSLGEEVKKKFCEIVNAKEFDKVFSNIFVSKDIILVSPHSKDRSGLAMTGLMLTGGSGLIGVLGMAAGSAIGQIFSNKQSENIQNILRNLENTLVINALTVEIKAYDYRRTWDVCGGEWETRISISGDAFFNGKNGDFSIVFPVEGKTYERTFFAKANNKVPELAKILGIPVPDIKKETKFIW